MQDLPREKLLKQGITGLTEVELLAIIIGSGSQQDSFLQIARSLWRKFPKLSLLADAELLQLQSVPGIGFGVASRLQAGFELSRRLYLPEAQPEIIRPAAVWQRLGPQLATKKREYTYALYLNSRQRLVAQELIAVGSLNQVNLEPRDLLVPAFQHNAAGIILVHNHPSGETTASPEDLQLTQVLAAACQMVGVLLLDHIIIARSGWRSLRADGHLD